MAKERETWIDVWKGILIFLVVFGHVIGGMRAFVGDASFTVLHQVYTAVYLFHMPAFFFAAGLVRARGNREPVSFGRFVRLRAWRLLVPYAVWGVVSAVLFGALSGWAGLATDGAGHGFYAGLRGPTAWWMPLASLVHAGGWPSGEGFRCNGVLWFLPCFFVVQLIVELVIRVRGVLKIPPRLRWAVLPLVALVSSSIGWLVSSRHLGGLPWCLDRAPWFVSFEIAGWIVGELRNPGLRTASWARGCAGLGCFLALAWQYPDLSYCGRSAWWYGAQVGLALAGTLVSVEFARLLTGWPTLARGVARLGAASLGVMLFHKFFVLAGQSAYRCVVPDEIWPVSVLLALALSVAVSVGSYACVRVIWRWMPWTLGK